MNSQAGCVAQTDGLEVQLGGAQWKITIMTLMTMMTTKTMITMHMIMMMNMSILVQITIITTAITPARTKMLF